MAGLEVLLNAVWGRLGAVPCFTRPLPGNYVSFDDCCWPTQIIRLSRAIAIAATDRLQGWTGSDQEALVYVPDGFSAKLETPSGQIFPTHRVAFTSTYVAFVNTERGTFDLVVSMHEMIERTLSEIISWNVPSPIELKPVEPKPVELKPVESEPSKAAVHQAYSQLWRWWRAGRLARALMDVAVGRTVRRTQLVGFRRLRAAARAQRRHVDRTLWVTSIAQSHWDIRVRTRLSHRLGHWAASARKTREAARLGRRRGLARGLATWGQWLQSAATHRDTMERLSAARVSRLFRRAFRYLLIASRTKAPWTSRGWAALRVAVARDRQTWAPPRPNPRRVLLQTALRRMRIEILGATLDQLSAFKTELSPLWEQDKWVETFMGPHTVLCSPVVHMGVMAVYRMIARVLARGNPRRELTALVSRIKLQEIRRAAGLGDQWHRCRHCAFKLAPKRKPKSNMVLCRACSAVYCNDDCLVADHEAGRYLTCCTVNSAANPTDPEAVRSEVLQVVLVFVESEMLVLPGNPLHGINVRGNEHAGVPLSQLITRMFVGALAMHAAANTGMTKIPPSALITHVVRDLPKALAFVRLVNVLVANIRRKPTAHKVALQSALRARELTKDSTDPAVIATAHLALDAAEQLSLQASAALTEWLEWLEAGGQDRWMQVLSKALANEPLLHGRVAVRAVVAACFVKGLVTKGSFSYQLDLPFFQRSEPICNDAANLVIPSAVRAMTDEARAVLWQPICPQMFGEPVHWMFSVESNTDHPMLSAGDTRRGYGPLFSLIATATRIAYSDAPVPGVLGALSTITDCDPLGDDGGHPIFVELVQLVRYETAVMFAARPMSTMIQAGTARGSLLRRQFQSVALQEDLARTILEDLEDEGDPLTDIIIQALDDMTPRAILGVLRTVLYATGEGHEQVASILTHCAVMSDMVPDELPTADLICRLRARILHLLRQWPNVAHFNNDPLFRFAYQVLGDWYKVCIYARVHDPEMLAAVLYDRA
jgi:hypothetical protein